MMRALQILPEEAAFYGVMAFFGALSESNSRTAPLQSPEVIAKFGRIPLAACGSIDASLTALGLSLFFGGVQ